jgi:hypothetical protein
MNKYGWSSDYSAEIAETICDRLVYGESLRDSCADRAMPAATWGTKALAYCDPVTAMAVAQIETLLGGLCLLNRRSCMALAMVEAAAPKIESPNHRQQNDSSG